MAKSNEERFWKYVRKTRKCWLWKGSLGGGYGQIQIGERLVYVHRFSWELHNGPILNDMLVLHKCDIKNCVNPSHLFLGTQQDNIKDMWEKGRQGKHIGAAGEEHPNVKLTWKEVRLIRKIYKKHSFSKTQQQLADRFGVSQAIINDILLNKIWKE